MMTLRVTTSGLSIALLIGLSGSAQVHGAAQQDRNGRAAGQNAGAQDPRQHGYDHGYRDGADRGRQDRERGTANGFKDDDYQVGAREYEGAARDRTTYMNGYREGYQAGYGDGYGDHAGQYGQLYGRPAAQPPARDDTAGSWSAGHVAFDAGYRGGITSGQQDQARNLRSNFRGTTAYQNADLGYRPNDGDRDAYRVQFRDGFERGYQDGYGRTQYANDGGGYFPAQGRSGAVDTRDGQGSLDRSITVAGNRQWTPTNIRVNQGDTFRLLVTGEIRISPNADDRASSAGSLTHKFVSGAPLPLALAGALIGRIDNGRPFGIGNQTSLTMPASGILYLGINDDNVSDNSGQFQVVISW